MCKTWHWAQKCAQYYCSQESHPVFSLEKGSTLRNILFLWHFPIKVNVMNFAAIMQSPSSLYIFVLLPTPNSRFPGLISPLSPCATGRNCTTWFRGYMDVRSTGCSCMVPDDHKPQAVAASPLGLERGGGVKSRPTDVLLVCAQVS